MSGSRAHCSRCSHSWHTRKSPDQIDRPRCSECGAEQDAITFGEDSNDDGDDAGGDTPNPDLLQTAKRERQLQELRDSVSEQIQRVDGTAPEAAGHTVAREVRGPYRELQAVAEQLDGKSPDAYTLDELGAVRDRLTTIKSEIDEHAQELATVDGLADTIGDLQSERHEIQVEIEELRGVISDHQAEIDRLEAQIEEYYDVVNKLEEKEDVWEAGFEYGRRQGRIEGRELAEIRIPCPICEEPIPMGPGSRMHQQAIELLQREGWTHTVCAETLRSHT